MGVKVTVGAADAVEMINGKRLLHLTEPAGWIDAGSVREGSGEREAPLIQTTSRRSEGTRSRRCS